MKDTAVDVAGDMYFDRVLPELVLQFTPVDESEVRGIGGAIDKEDLVTFANKGTGTITNELLYDKGIKVW